MKKHQLRKTALLMTLGMFIAFLLLFLLPIDVVYDIKVDTKNYPSKEWRLIQDGSQYTTEFIDHRGNTSAPAKNFFFDRGDVIDIRFDEEVRNGTMVERDATLLQFSSMMHNLRIQRALNEIQINESRIAAGNAPFKWPLMQESMNAVKLAESNVRLQEANHARLSELKEQGVISQAELDAQTNRLEVAVQELEIANKRVSNASFEQKPEDVAVFNTMIGATDKELDVLLAQQASYTLRSPFKGQVKIQPEPGVILNLIDPSEQALIFPFPIDQRTYVGEHSVLEYETESGVEHLPFTLDNKVADLRGHSEVLGVAHCSAMNESFGMMRPARIVCDTITLREYILRKLL